MATDLDLLNQVVAERNDLKARAEDAEKRASAAERVAAKNTSDAGVITKLREDLKDVQRRLGEATRRADQAERDLGRKSDALDKANTQIHDLQHDYGQGRIAAEAELVRVQDALAESRQTVANQAGIVQELRAENDRLSRIEGAVKTHQASTDALQRALKA